MDEHNRWRGEGARRHGRDRDDWRREQERDEDTRRASSGGSGYSQESERYGEDYSRSSAGRGQEWRNLDRERQDREGRDQWREAGYGQGRDFGDYAYGRDFGPERPRTGSGYGGQGDWTRQGSGRGHQDRDTQHGGGQGPYQQANYDWGNEQRFQGLRRPLREASREQSWQGGREPGGEYGSYGGQSYGNQPYGGGQFGSGQYEGSQFSGGQFGSGQFGSGQFGTGQFGGVGQFGNQPYGNQQYGGSQYGGQREQQQQRRTPKSYQRSDDRIREDIYEQLIVREHLDAGDVTVEVREGRVTLTGEVPHRRMKHEIEDIADNCSGVQDVENNIRVKRGFLGALFGGHRDDERNEDRERGTSMSSGGNLGVSGSTRSSGTSGTASATTSAGSSGATSTPPTSSGGSSSRRTS